MVIILALTLITGSSVYADTEIELSDAVSIEKLDRRIELNNYSILAEKKLLANESDARYNLAEHIDVRIKNQKSTQNCWAFSTLNALETNIALTTNNTEKPYYSVRHMNYSTTREFLNNQINEWGYNRNLNSYGSIEIGLSYMTRGSGPINETDMPFQENEELINISAISGKNVQKKIEDYIKFPRIRKEISENRVKYIDAATNKEYEETEALKVRTQIKKHIITYGGVTAATIAPTAQDAQSLSSSLYYNYTATYNGKTYPAFYCYDSNAGINHFVTIIGWDDNYPKTNFKTQPKNNGAYLVLNSYGSDATNPGYNNFFPEGIYYISYDDIYIESSCTGIIRATNIDYDNIYQHDPFGISSSIIMEADNVYGANIFTKTNKNEKLKEISVASLKSGKVDVYVNAMDDDIDINSLTLVKQGVNIRQGYTTIKLNSIELKGNKFVVALKYYGQDSTEETSIGVEYPKTGPLNGAETMWSVATSEENQSFYGVMQSTGKIKWIDLKNVEQLENTNICIKAFTENENFYVDEIPGQQYTSHEIKPNVIVTDKNNNRLAENVDYTLRYEDNIGIGYARAIVTGKGNYTGTIVREFRIVDRVTDIRACKVYNLGKYEYTGSEIKPRISIKNLQGDILEKNTDYTLEYSNNIEIGTGKIKIKGIGAYSGETEKTFEIVEVYQGEKYGIQNCTVKITSIAQTYYDGKPVEPEITVTDENGNVLQRDIDYEVEFYNNTGIGTGYMTITGKMKYEGQKTCTFLIIQKPAKVEPTRDICLENGYCYLDRTNKKIININPNTEEELFARFLKSKYNITNEIEISNEANYTGDYIVTGAQVIVDDETYIAVVRGDIDANGITDSSDVIAMRMAIIHLKTLTGANKEAADIDLDGKEATAADFARALDYIAGLQKTL